MTAEEQDRAVPLCVDLDETLIQTDLLFESLSAALRHDWRIAFKLPLWLLHGRGYLKAEIARRVSLRDDALPCSDEFIFWLRAQKASGRPVILATGSDQGLATQAVAGLEIFDEVIGSSPDANQVRNTKAHTLTTRFGEKGFDYAGNGWADVPVWKSARKAIGVRVAPGFWERLDHPDKQLISFQSRNGPKLVLQSLRAHHWIKNVLLFVPAFTAHVWNRPGILLLLTFAFAAFGAAASAIYLINDFLDVAADRAHVGKRGRPLAEGRLTHHECWIVIGILLIGAIAFAWQLPLLFRIELAIYVVASLVYSLGLKRVVYADIGILAGLYALRILAGAAAVQVPVSIWLLLFSGAFFFSLAAVKRHTELRGGAGYHEDWVSPQRGYRLHDRARVGMLGSLAAVAAVTVFVIYSQSADVTHLYHHPGRLLWISPCFAAWLARIWVLSQRGKMKTDPVVFALRDPWSYALGIAVLALVFWAAPR